jgi:hypothetical protein
MRQQKFQARINSDEEGVSEDISAHIPVISRTDNMEILVHEIMPGLNWTWSKVHDQLGWCMDEDMSNIYQPIKEGIALADRNQAPP